MAHAGWRRRKHDGGPFRRNVFTAVNRYSASNLVVAMAISPFLLRGLFGLEVDSVARRVTLRPHLPPDWTAASVSHVGITGGHLNFKIDCTMSGLTLKTENQGAGNLTILFAPAYSPYTTVTAATLDDRPSNSLAGKREPRLASSDRSNDSGRSDDDCNTPHTLVRSRPSR